MTRALLSPILVLFLGLSTVFAAERTKARKHEPAKRAAQETKAKLPPRAALAEEARKKVAKAHAELSETERAFAKAQQQLAEAQAPVYSVGYGASAISQAALDLAVEDEAGAGLRGFASPSAPDVFAPMFLPAPFLSS